MEQRGYRKLEVFERANALLRPLHELALEFPDYEKYDLASQIRRASKSIVANIAEGYAKRRSAREFVSYLANALGSANELEVHLGVAETLGYVDHERCQGLIEECRIVGKQLRRLMEYWRSIGDHQRPATRN